ncbi:MAG: hypothetical protein KJ017_00330 [Alphaproteobacteria bacterium]|nr:hypothetical protein [Alphaproteobacteria bacterium]
MDQETEKKTLTEDEAKALGEGLREAAQLQEQVAEFQETYRALDKKYPLKSKSKYKD